MAIQKAATRTIYHIKNGPQAMYHVDARHALRFKDEWSETPWKHDGQKSAPIVEIPEGWEEHSAHERIALAVKLGADRKGLTAAKADEVILAEVEKRAEASEEGDGGYPDVKPEVPYGE